MAHLLDREAYEDLYDHIMVEGCRELEATSGDSLALYVKRAIYAAGRPECIGEWMKRDMEKDDFEKNTPTPNFPCNNCGISMNLWSKFLENGRGKEKYRMLFFYKCLVCEKKKTIYDNGEEEDIIVSCEKCNSQNVETTSRQKKNGTVHFREVCFDCGHIKKSNFVTRKKEKIDLKYENDKKRFYMSQEELEQLKFFVANGESILAKRKERFAKTNPIPEQKTSVTVFHLDPFESRYFDRI